MFSKPLHGAWPSRDCAPGLHAEAPRRPAGLAQAQAAAALWRVSGAPVRAARPGDFLGDLRAAVSRPPNTRKRSARDVKRAVEQGKAKPSLVEAGAALQALQSVPRATWVKTALQAGALGLLLAGHPYAAGDAAAGGALHGAHLPRLRPERLHLAHLRAA